MKRIRVQFFTENKYFASAVNDSIASEQYYIRFN